MRFFNLPNKFKFQGQEHVDDLGLGWDSFKWRNHQPDIGRFFNVDPLAEKYLYNSPYAFSENKVVAHVEIEGLEAEWADKAKKYIQQGKEAATQAVDRTAQAALNATAEKIYPGVGKLNESQKQEVFKTSANGTVAVLLSEFANGTGQEKRELGPDTPMTQQVVEGRVMEEIQEDFYSQVNKSGMTMEQFSSGKNVAFGLEFSPDQTSITESASKHLNSNLPQFFVGGANVSVTPGEKGSANVTITNPTSRSSLMLHGGNNYPRTGNGNQKPLSTIHQTFRTTMPLDPNRFPKVK